MHRGDGRSKPSPTVSQFIPPVLFNPMRQASTSPTAADHLVLHRLGECARCSGGFRGASDASGPPGQSRHSVLGTRASYLRRSMGCAREASESRTGERRRNSRIRRGRSLRHGAV
ncbi:hypothetical protein N177_0884 [Lutibaculum baratangense AMV1]|uniref:Uncharacterized protein n=1 Tax=Lutibaculum baratangense AMV1 TaxID=631454 RepID=V4RM94_9HYPH|nr:hypothetical protein N177_0884 [Lutibaculum baratangense AMV1]